MERTDSTAAMAALADTYKEDSDAEDPQPSFIDNISDEESMIKMNDDKMKTEEEEIKVEEKYVTDDQGSKPVSPALSADSDEALNRKRRATKLVSYGADELDEDKSSESDNSEALDTYDLTLVKTVNYSSLSRSVRDLPLDSITLPPEPPGRCSNHLQEKISKMYERVKRGYDITGTILKKKEFRNPSIYEKLIEFCGIDEKGTNYPPDVFDPHCWGKESFYDSLAEAQKKEMDKREKEKKDRTKIEFMTGVKKTKSTSSVNPQDLSGNKKSKWDGNANSQSRQNIVVTSSTNIPVISTTTSSSGTKTTLISAVGNIMEKYS